MLEIRDLTVAIDGESTPILKGLNLSINSGKVHAIMGPNGSGKSTLSHVLAGHTGYSVLQGSIQFMGQDLLVLAPEERAILGIFLAFQYPVAIPGINNMYFLKEACNRIRQGRHEKSLDAVDFLAQVRTHLKQIGLDESFLKRSLNDGFSGGEKKSNEILQMLMLQPKLAILDETDSGLDIDALQAISKVINQQRTPQRSWLLVTHYQRLLSYIQPDYVHILYKGRIVKTGDHNLALRLEKEGYGWLQAEATHTVEGHD